jgi:hypothetical protein
MADHMISVPSEQAKCRPEKERRAWVRYGACQEVSCGTIPGSTAEEPETGWLGRLRNVSTGGLGLRLRRRFEPGTLLLIELLDEAKGERRSLPVQVIHATAEGRKLWTIGCQFLSPLSDEELKALVGE